MFRVLGLTGAFAAVVGVDVAVGFGVVVTAAGVVVVVVLGAAAAAGALAPGVEGAVEVEGMLPVAGVLVAAGAAGRVVMGVGTAGNGCDMILAIISFRPASEPL